MLTLCNDIISDILCTLRYCEKVSVRWLSGARAEISCHFQGESVEKKVLDDTHFSYNFQIVQ